MTNPENIINRVMQTLATVALTGGLILAGFLLWHYPAGSWIKVPISLAIVALYGSAALTVWETDIHNWLFDRLYK